MSQQQRIWLITGISRGLGKALVQAALARGDTVIGTTREGTSDMSVASGKLHVLPLEITDAAAVTATVEQAFTLARRIDVVVNNAGYGLLGAIEEATDQEVERLFEVDVFSPFRLIRAMLPRLRAQGSGHIINITSIAGRAPMAGTGLYAAAKSAMEALSQSLAQEVAPWGIKVTAVAPGTFRTDFLSDHSIRQSRGGVADAYADTVGKAMDRLIAIAGRQTGDPARAAEAIIAAVEADAPPLHLLLGSDALRRAREQLATTTREIDAWEPISQSTDFAEGD